ncbi:MAG: N-acetyltransferase [Fimbriimonadaceae bacterium]|nr:N-acetyltransferase [Chitinophagales bacterium]
MMTDYSKELIHTENIFTIRLITESDVSEVLEIYKPYVLNTIISFEYDAPSVEEYLQRIKTITAEYPWLVCSQGNKIIGYAYAGKHRYRTAYQWSPESTVYLSPEVHRKGIARILYETLFSILRLQGYFNVYAGIGLPNEKSVRFHKALGFEEIGIFKKVGYKFGNWHDTQWFQFNLIKHIENPPVPKTIKEIENNSDFKTILILANEQMKNISIHQTNN